MENVSAVEHIRQNIAFLREEATEFRGTAELQRQSAQRTADAAARSDRLADEYEELLAVVGRREDAAALAV